MGRERGQNRGFHQNPGSQTRDASLQVVHLTITLQLETKMIPQHFIRSPSLRQKLNDRYAGVELATGKFQDLLNTQNPNLIIHIQAW